MFGSCSGFNSSVVIQLCLLSDGTLNLQHLIPQPPILFLGNSQHTNFSHTQKHKTANPHSQSNNTQDWRQNINSHTQVCVDIYTYICIYLCIINESSHLYTVHTRWLISTAEANNQLKSGKSRSRNFWISSMLPNPFLIYSCLSPFFHPIGLLRPHPPIVRISPLATFLYRSICLVLEPHLLVYTFQTKVLSLSESNRKFDLTW